MMMVFISIYGVVDGLFISNFVGKIPFAAVNLVMPVLMVLGGTGFMIGTGGSALVAKTLGMGEKEKANRYFSMMVLFTVVAGIVLSVAAIIFIRPISYLLGATEEMIEDCVLYGRVSLVFNTAFMLQNVFQNFLTTAEKPKLGLSATVAAGVGNMVLDALFIVGFNWGVAGAALATGISECIGALLPFLYFIRKNDSLLRLRKAGMELRVIVKACTNGVSELLSSASGSLVSMVFNLQLLRFAGENGIAAYGTLMYIQFIFIAIFIGYTIGIGPVVSYHYGAENHGELKSLLKKSTLLTGLMGTGMMVLATILAVPLAQVFVGYDRELFEMTKHAVMIFSGSFVLTGFNIFVSSFFTALNDGLVSGAISILRSLVFRMLSVLVLPMLLGLDGIWWAITVAEVCSLLVSLLFLAGKRKKYHYF